MNNQKQHITAEQIQRYVSHRMNEKERAAFEEELKNDPFAKEAVEGFNSLNDSEDGALLYASTTALITTKAGIPSKVVSEAKMIPLYKVGTIAASITILIASAFWINSQFGNDSNIAMADSNEENIEQEDKEVVSESSILENSINLQNDTSSITLGQDINDESPDVLSEIEDFKIKDSENIDAKPDINNNTTQPTATIINTPESQIVEIEEEEVEIISTSQNAEEDDVLVETTSLASVDKKERSSENKNLAGMFYDTQASTESDEYESVAPSPVDETTIYKHGLSLYQAGEYTEAIIAFEETIRNKQHLDEAHYYQGLCYYYLGKYTKATKHLDLMITNETSFKANAQWYKADMLLKKGKTEEAKAIFQILAQGNSSFKELAQEKLDSL